MLQIKNVCKTYVTGDLTQTALNDVSFNLRDNEFVAVLGPSGSGKTTMLNVVGGLDRYDSGDLVINGVSTKQYTDRDWDSYRNHTIGFVFQSYNLIPHQTVLANVELALTISGMDKAQRREKAAKALEAVGLGDQLHKKPNQMSGGQMQRVAIARALVNDPDILLADEPTGALDSENSVQVMELLRDVAKDRLVVLVTHNNELAQEYATRIISLRDGKITGDTDPYELDEAAMAPPEHKNLGKASMSFGTALSLSFNNLRTKKGRTILTAFAGSIGIIGIALIMSLSTGVNTYISDIQKDTMLSYPLTIDAQTLDLGSMMELGQQSVNKELDHELDGVYSNPVDFEMASSYTTSLTKNNLSDFKKYLDDPKSDINPYLGENGVIYSYDLKYGLYSYDPENVLVNADGVTVDGSNSTSSMMGAMAETPMADAMKQKSQVFTQLLPGRDGSVVSSAVTDHYDLLYGKWPTEYNETVLMLDEHNEIPLSIIYELGLLPASEYNDMMDKLEAGEKLPTEETRWDYKDACEQTFYLIPACNYYSADGDVFKYTGNDKAAVDSLMDSAVKLKITGVVRPANSGSYKMYGNVGYTAALTDYLIDYTASSAVVKAQKASPKVNVLSGLEFKPADDAAKIADARAYLSSMNVSDKAAMCANIMSMVYAGNPQQLEMILGQGEQALANMLDMYLSGAKDDAMLDLYDTYISPGSYDDNMTDFGVVSLDAPSSISIYSDSFENKDAISACIDQYNATATTENQITYTDFVGLLMSSVTTIVNVISYVLIAFVGVSLVVSSIMIGIITYISVLERTKEIGILRAIGASKRNISQVFNAETFIIGLFSGLIGVGVTLLLLIPGNAIIHSIAGTANVNAALPALNAVILVLLSMALTLVAGIIPSKKAAKRDPVTALRTE